MYTSLNDCVNNHSL